MDASKAVAIWVNYKYKPLVNRSKVEEPDTWGCIMVVGSMFDSVNLANRPVSTEPATQERYESVW